MKKNDLEKWEGKLETDVKSNQLKSFLNTNWFVWNVYWRENRWRATSLREATPAGDLRADTGWVSLQKCTVTDTVEALENVCNLLD